LRRERNLTIPADRRRSDLTHSATVAERDPAWSPDGKSIAYFSDESVNTRCTSSIKPAPAQ